MPAQFEAQAKKKRREQGKMHRGAQLANTGERRSRFKPYTVKLKQRACQPVHCNRNNNLAPECEPFRVTRIVSFRRPGTWASPSSSVWQNGDAGLAVLPKGVADGTGSALVANSRLEAVDATRGCIRGYDVLS
jgi:hypothetical protein